MERDALPEWMLPRDGQAQGLRQGLNLREGLSVARTDLRYGAGADFRFPCQGEFLKFHFKLSGQSAISDDKGEYQPVEPGRISVLVQPRDSVKRERVSANSRESAVTLVCDRAFLSEIVPRDVQAPTDVRDFLKSRTSKFSLMSLAMPPHVRPLVEDILNPPLQGSLAGMIIEARALELLSFALHEILYAPVRVDVVRRRDREKVKALCEMFDENPSCGASIAELCRLMVWNETQMAQCFKAVTGMTISAYRHQVRMERARRQLKESDASITEIALDAGYEHPSNFTTAFKRTFGHTPKAARGRSFL